MKMIPVDSSDLQSVGYENGTLLIKFHSGGVYSYSGVPYSIYQNLMVADSCGRFFRAFIEGYYPYVKIG